jgi:hypothetical protein
VLPSRALTSVRRAIVTASLALACFFGAGALAYGLLAPDPAVLTITTAPDGAATVRLDGVTRGRAPLTFDELQPGTHHIEVVAPGYRALERIVHVPEGGSMRLELGMEQLD